VRPNDLCDFWRLITSVEVLGCSTGNSAALDALHNLSRKNSHAATLTGETVGQERASLDKLSLRRYDRERISARTGEFGYEQGKFKGQRLTTTLPIGARNSAKPPSKSF